MVDGTKGDVELKRVDVTLGKSKFDARGVVEGTKGIKGKRVVVNVKSSSANLGELLRLVSKGAARRRTATLIIDAAMDLPQGKEKSSSGSRSKDRCGRSASSSPRTSCRTRSTS